MAYEEEDRAILEQAYAKLKQDEIGDIQDKLSSDVAASAIADPATNDVLQQAAAKIRSYAQEGAAKTQQIQDKRREFSLDRGAMLTPEERAIARGDVQPEMAQPTQTAVPKEQIFVPQAAADAQVLAQNGQPSQAYKLMENALQLQSSAALGSAAAQSEGYRQEAAYSLNAANEIQKSAAVYAEKRAQMEQKIAEQVAKQNAAIEDFSSMKVSPDRFWANADTPNKIMMGIGLALSAYGGDVEKSINIINQAIERDIDAQKSDILVAGRSVDQKSNLVTQLRQSLGDVNQAEEIARANQLKDAELKIKAAMANSNSKVALENGKQVIGALQAQQAEALQKATESGANRAVALMETAAQTSKNGEPIPWEVAKQNNLISEKDLGRVIPHYGVLNEGESVEKVSNGIVAYKRGLALLDEMKKLSDQYGGEILPTKAKAIMDSKAGEFAAYVKEAEALGAYDNGVQKLTEKIGGDLSGSGITRWFYRVSGKGDPVSARIQELAQTYAAKHVDTMNTKLRIAAPDYQNSMRGAKLSGLASKAQDRYGK